MKIFRTPLFLILLISLTFSCIPGSDSYNDGPSNLEIADVFKNDMVIQQGKEIAIWGSAYKTTKVNVELNGTSVSTITKKDGTWSVNLPSKKIGGPYTLKIYANDTTVVFNNIMIITGFD